MERKRSKVNDKIKVLIIGAGRRGTTLIKILSQYQNIFSIEGVADINEEAEGIKLAKELNIKVDKDYRRLLSKDIDVILNTSGDLEIQSILDRTRGENTELMGECATKLLWSLLFESQNLYTQLKQKVTKLNIILDSLVEGVLVVDQNKEIILMNSQAQKLLSLDNQHRIEKDNILYDFFDKAFKEKEKKYITLEIFYRDKNSQLKTLKARASKIQDPNCNLSGVITTIQDITKEKEIDRMKEEILSNVSHEMRTPLTSINNSIYLLLNKIPGYINPDQQKLLLIIKRNAERLMCIINNLLDLSKIEAGAIELKIELINIKEVVEEAYFQVKTLAEAKKLNVKIEIPEKFPKIYASKDAVEHILINLLSNAIKFTPAEGNISIIVNEYSEDKDYVIFSVEDTGVGIPEDSLDKIFDKFSQLENPLSAKTEGSGVGLSIAKFFTEAQNGRIWVESKEHVGSKFKFILPNLYKYLEINLRKFIDFAKSNGMPFSIIYLKLKDDTCDRYDVLEAQIRANIHREDLTIRVEEKNFILILLKDTNKQDAEAIYNRIVSLSKEEMISSASILTYPHDFKEYEDIIRLVKIF